MKTRAIAIGCAGLMALHVSAALRGETLKNVQPSARNQISPPTAATDIDAETRALLGKYCVSCHNQKLKTGGLALDAEAAMTISTQPEIWEKAVRKLRAGQMPPQAAPKPEAAVLTGWVAGLEKALDAAAASHPNPGRVPAAHRLNRTEYPNVIRDLLALDVDAAMLPVEDAGYGFDNIADVLTVSPSLIDRYELAAAKVSALAVGARLSRPTAVTYSNSPLLWQEERQSEDLPLGSRGGLAVRHTFPNDGEYEINIHIPMGSDFSQHVRDLEGNEPLEVQLDFEQVRLIQPKPKEVRGAQACGNACTDAYENQGLKKDSPLSFRLPVKAGPHLLGISFVSDLTNRMPINARPARPSVKSFLSGSYRKPIVIGVQIVGPFAAVEASDTPSRRRIFVCQPATSRDEEPCARKILTTLAHRAYRGTDTDADVQKLMATYAKGRAEGNFETGIEWAIETLLVQPAFLFRVERDPANVRVGVPYRISDLELASRLSFFIWSSIPDDELLVVAKRGKLNDPVVLQQQVKRMLADPKSVTLAKNFAGQWLWLRKLQHVQPDPYLYPSFDDSLRQAMQQETELFFDSQVREDHSVSELLTANYTFVNEVLAKHYGILNVYGDQFRRVTLADERRFGLLGQGSVLTVSSYANRTSPVIRGKWLLENFLGTPPPPPPPNVPSLKENGEGAKPTTVRERLEQHRKNPVCASCHRNMDPLGFALENFDAIGQWRAIDAESKDAIDPSGEFADGVKFGGVVAFRRALVAQRRVQFIDTVVEKLMTYATGRGMEYYDRPAIRQVLREAAANDYRWSSIILGIVKSQPFQMRIEPADSTQLRAENTSSPTRRP
jgi:hypothetical protein